MSSDEDIPAAIQCRPPTNRPCATSIAQEVDLAGETIGKER
jgi:hypothetical protein